MEYRLSVYDLKKNRRQQGSNLVSHQLIVCVTKAPTKRTDFCQSVIKRNRLLFTYWCCSFTHIYNEVNII